MGWKNDIKRALPIAVGGLIGGPVGALAGAALGGLGGGGSQSAPESGLNDVAQSQLTLGREQMALAREESAAARTRQAEFDPLYKDLINQAMESSRTADQRSAEEWDRYTTTFRPVEDKMVQDATSYDSAGRRDDAASAAAADVGLRFDQAKQAREADIRRGGGTSTGGLDSGYIEQAKATAGASQQARRAVEATGLQLVDNAARFGRGLTSTGLQAQGLGLQAGQAAGAGLAGNQATYNASMAPAQSFYSGATNSNNSAGSLLAGLLRSENDQDAATMSGLGSLATVAATAYF